MTLSYLPLSWSGGFAWLVLLSCLLLGACTRANDAGDAPPDAWQAARTGMVNQIRRMGISDPNVIAAMLRVPRHAFVPEAYRGRFDPYGNHPGPIGHDQTISQPFIVAYMTEKMAVQPGESVLEIGTGSGYQAAVLAELDAKVYTIEIIPELADHARRALRSQGYDAVQVRAGDGYKGWPEHAPFDVILVTCAPEAVPADLVAQLREGGRMIVPVGVEFQRLVILRKQAGEIERIEDLPVRFVPMVPGPAANAIDPD